MNKLARTIIVRILAAILLIVLAIMTPWWVTLGAGLAFTLIFSWYVEFLVVALLLDLLYSNGAFLSHPHNVIFTLTGVVVFLGMTHLQSRLALE